MRTVPGRSIEGIKRDLRRVLRAFAERTRWMDLDGSSREPLADLVSDDRIEAVMADYGADRRTPAINLGGTRTT